MRLIVAMELLGVYCWLICWLILPPASLLAHDLDDGFVEKAVQVRIRDGELSIEYAIGLTEPTMNQLLAAEPRLPLPAKEPPAVSVRERFKHHLETWMQKQFSTKINDKKCRLEIHSISDYPKHHYDFVVEMSCKLPADRSLELRIQDGAFGQLDGAARFALKSTGKTLISRTNVAPIIIRAKRHEFSALKPDERHNACQINATIVNMVARAKD